MRSSWEFCLRLVLASTISLPLNGLSAQDTGSQSNRGRPLRIKLDGRSEARQIVSRAEPTYPEEAKRKHIEGQVVLHAIIGGDGSVKELSVISAPQELTESALAAVKQWRYKPTLLNGTPVEVDTTIIVDYSLEGASGNATKSAESLPPSATGESPGRATSRIQEPAPCSSPSKTYSDAMCLEDLGNVYEQQGKYADAEFVLKRALEVREKTKGPGDPDVAWGAQRLAYSFIQDGKYSDAEPYLKRAIAIREKALGPDDRDVAESLRLLGQVYDHESRYEEAERVYNRALAIRETNFPPDQPGYGNVAESLQDLGLLYVSEDKYSQAEPFLQRSLQIREKEYPSGHPYLAMSLDHLANVYTLEAKYAEAEPLYKRALAIVETPRGSGGGPFAIPVMEDYAAFLQITRRSTEAQDMKARAQAIRDNQQQ